MTAQPAPSPITELPPTPEPAAYIVRAIPTALVPRFWPFAEPYVKRALDRATGEFSAADILGFLKQSVVQLWLVYDGKRVVGAVTTEVVTFPNRRRLRVLTLGGSDVDSWATELDAKLCEWAITAKCDGIEAYVRKGLVPKMRRSGYTHRLSMVFKPMPKEKGA